MPGKNTRTKNDPALTAADNFQRIKGLTSAIEKRLQQAGILSYEKLALLSAKEIFVILGRPSRLSVKRIAEQDWSGQAEELAMHHKSPKPAGSEITSTDPHYRNEGFAVDFFVDENNQVYSIHVLHVKSGESAELKGWDAKQLAQFYRRFGVNLPVVNAEISAPNISSGLDQAQPIMAETNSTLSEKITNPEIQNINLRQIETLSSDFTTDTMLLQSGAPFDVRLSFEFAEEQKFLQSKLPPTDLKYTALISAKQIGENFRIKLSERSGAIKADTRSLVINIPEPELEPGTYRLEASLFPKAKGEKMPVKAARHSTSVSKIIQVL